jgi:hypothetical protein
MIAPRHPRQKEQATHSLPWLICERLGLFRAILRRVIPIGILQEILPAALYFPLEISKQRETSRDFKQKLHMNNLWPPSSLDIKERLRLCQAMRLLRKIGS